jgi:hypothetical protein
MMSARIAFTAEFYGEQAVVCLAQEDRPGAVIDQELGRFETWTQANAFAIKLNDRLAIAPADVRQIVISAMLRGGRALRTAGGDESVISID